MSQPASDSVERPAPEDYQPRLRWYSHLWRFVAMAAVGFLVWAQVAEWISDTYPIMIAVDAVAGVASYVLVHFRRRWPLTIVCAVSALAAVSAIANGPAVLALVSVATRRVWWQSALAGVVSFTSACAFSWWTGPATEDSGWLTLSLNVVVTIALIGWGQYLGSRRELFWTLRRRAETAEAERDLRAREARTTERARIAREMHDVLAHRISQISMHAGALTYRDDLSPEQMRESVAVIQDKAHEALSDLRGVLGVLRDEHADVSRPQPTYDDLPALIADARVAGVPIEYDDGLSEPPPDAVGRAAYRIVQEGITNANKHAPQATLRISVEGSAEDGLTVVLRNRLGFGPTATPGAGLGLVGLTERAELRGGRLEHRIVEGTFELEAWLPWAP